LLERGPHEGHSGASRWWTLVQHRTAWEPPEMVRAVRAVWTFGGGRCYSLAPASVDLLLAHPLSSNRNSVPARSRASLRGGVSRRPGCWPSARPLFISALVEPSRAAFRPLTPRVVSWHQHVGSISDRQLLPREPLSSSRGSVSPRDQDRSTVPSFRRSHLPWTRRWRNDPRRLPSYRTFCLPPQIHAAFQPRTPDASRRRTDSNDVPSLWRSGVPPAHRSARTPTSRRLCGRVPSFGPGSRPPLATHPLVEMGCRRPRQRIVRFAMGLLALSRPTLRQCGEHELDAFRSTSASHCFTTSTRACRVPSIFPRLAPRRSPMALPLGKRTGGPCGSRCQDPLRRAVRVRVRRFRPLAPGPTVPLTSLSPGRALVRCFRTEPSLDRAKTTSVSAPWRAAYAGNPRCLPSPALPRPPRAVLVSRAVTWLFPLRPNPGVPSRPTLRAFARRAWR